MKYVSLIIFSILSFIVFTSCNEEEIEENKEEEYIYQKSDFCFGPNETENALTNGIIIKCDEKTIYKWYCPNKEMPKIENVFYDNANYSHYMTGFYPKGYDNTYFGLHGGYETGESYFWASFVCQGNLFTYRIKVRTIAAETQSTNTDTATE